MAHRRDLTRPDGTRPKITVASIQTLRQRLDAVSGDAFRIVIVDEARSARSSRKLRSSTTCAPPSPTVGCARSARSWCRRVPTSRRCARSRASSQLARPRPCSTRSCTWPRSLRRSGANAVTDPRSSSRLRSPTRDRSPASWTSSPAIRISRSPSMVRRHSIGAPRSWSAFAAGNKRSISLPQPAT